MNTPLSEDFFQRGFWWAQEAVASGDEVLFGENLPNEAESPDDDEEVPLLEKGEGKGLEDENRGEGELLTINIEKAETPDDKAKEAQSPAPKNPDPQKEEWEPPNEGVRDGTLYPQGFFATHNLELERRDWEHQDVNHQRMVRIAWLVVWMAAHDMWFSYDFGTDNRQVPRRRRFCLGATGIPDARSREGRGCRKMERNPRSTRRRSYQAGADRGD
jgi:hypothetical protein